MNNDNAAKKAGSALEPFTIPKHMLKAKKKKTQSSQQSQQLKPTTSKPATDASVPIHDNSLAVKATAASSSPPPALESSTVYATPKKRPFQPFQQQPLLAATTAAATTAADSSSSTSNVYDAVLGEAQDLLLAASEAQQLGRYKLASAYLFLLHARLVGLGKRFDKANNAAKMGTTSNNYSISSRDGINASLDAPVTPSSSVNPTTLFSPKTNAARQLAHMLPSNIQLDQAMMEHLAKAAVELHAQRCGGNKRASKKTAPVAIWKTELGSPSSNQASQGNVKQQHLNRTPEQQQMDSKQSTQVEQKQKLPVAAMFTVPHANCDARALLQPQQHRRGEDHARINDTNSKDGTSDNSQGKSLK
jgi:hypothetical protein